MADGSKDHEKQTESGSDHTIHVRLKWDRCGDQGWVLHLDTLCLTVEPSEQGLDWSALVEVPNAGDHLEYFENLEEAMKYCEDKAKELLRKDLDRLGGVG